MYFIPVISEQLLTRHAETYSLVFYLSQSPDIDQFHATGPFLYPLNKSEDRSFFRSSGGGERDQLHEAANPSPDVSLFGSRILVKSSVYQFFFTFRAKYGTDMKFR